MCYSSQQNMLSCVIFLISFSILTALPTVTTENSNSSNEGPVRLVVATLVILLTLNALLYYKLWALEEKVFVHTTPFPALDPSMFR